jgi:hypothetical protein
MSNKSSILTAFNEHFVEFLNDVQMVFPQDPDILAAKNSLLLIRKANPKLFIKAWVSYVVGKYHTMIEAGNIDFFIHKDYSEDLSETENQSKIIDGINRLRKPISTLSQENQEKVMKYLQNLNKLAILYESTLSTF